MLILRLALRNLLGTGIRLWLNVGVIGLSVSLIIFARGMYAGLSSQMLDGVIASETAGGQLWAAGLDPYDPVSFNDGTAVLPPELDPQFKQGRAIPVLYRTATLYARGRALAVTLKGIPPEQDLLPGLPVRSMGNPDPGAGLPCVLGLRMKALLALDTGEVITVKWRDRQGAFDAMDLHVTGWMDALNPRVDEGSVWLPLKTLQQICGLDGRASLIVVAPGTLPDKDGLGHWTVHDTIELTDWIRALIRSDEQWMRMIFLLLLFLSGVGLFNSQLLSVVKRRREIGTLLALGMPGPAVTKLFLSEGLLVVLLGFIVAGLFGGPVLWWIAAHGIPMDHADGLGIPVPRLLIPRYSPAVVLTTLGFVFCLMSLVSWWPVRRIAAMDPARALSGRES